MDREWWVWEDCLGEKGLSGGKRGNLGFQGEDEEGEEEVAMTMGWVGLKGRDGFGRRCGRLGGGRALCWGQSNGC